MVTEDSTVTATIYDVTGKQIRIIELGHIAAGNYVESNKAIYWDGRTGDGEQVSSGTYFYQIRKVRYLRVSKVVSVLALFYLSVLWVNGGHGRWG